MTRRIHALRVGNFKVFADTQRIPVRDRVLQARRLCFKEFPAFICTSKRYGRVYKTRPAEGADARRRINRDRCASRCSAHPTTIHAGITTNRRVVTAVSCPPFQISRGQTIKLFAHPTGLDSSRESWKRKSKSSCPDYAMNKPTAAHFKLRVMPPWIGGIQSQGCGPTYAIHGNWIPAILAGMTGNNIVFIGDEL